MWSWSRGEVKLRSSCEHSRGAARSRARVLSVRHPQRTHNARGHTHKSPTPTAHPHPHTHTISQHVGACGCGCTHMWVWVAPAPVGRPVRESSFDIAHSARAPVTKSRVRAISESRAPTSARAAAIDPVVILSRTGDGAVAQPPVALQFDDNTRRPRAPTTRADRARRPRAPTARARPCSKS